MLPWIEIAVRWLNLIAITSVVGGFIVSLACLRGQFLQSLGFGWAIFWSRVAIVVSLGLLAQHIQPIAALAEPPQTTLWLLANVLTQTRWGQAWLLQVIGLSVFIICAKSLAQMPRPPRAGITTGLGVCSVVVMCVAQSLTSHAAQSAVGLVVQSAHTLAASVWMGGLAVMALTSAMVFRRSNSYHQQTLKQLWQSFSWLALVSMVVLIASGLFTLSQQAATLDALLMSGYGKALLAKIVVIAFVMLLAATNWLALRRSSTDLLRLLERARIEVLLGVVILAVTALLTAT